VQRLQDDSAPPESEGPFGIRFNDSEAQRRDIIHRAVLEALGDIGPNAKAAVPAIRSALKAQNGFVRASACVAFWKITAQVGPAVEPMVELLEKGNWSDKRQSATGLGRMGSAAEAAIPALVRALNDPDDGVRWDAAVALGCIGSKAREAIPALIELLKKDENVRDDIIKALKAIDAKVAAEAGVLAP
jgi:HEAT repeat protein